MVAVFLIRGCTTKIHSNKIIWQATGVIIILAAWEITSRFFPPLVVPPIEEVWQSLISLITQDDFPSTVLMTVMRLIAGLSIGISLGMIIGLISGIFWRADCVFAPLLSVLQSVPPVCWVVLALVWFGFNGRPSVFIVAASTIPTVAINLSHGVRNIDPKLLEMARLYDLTKSMRIRHIILPSVKPYLNSALEIVIGGGWKLAVMGEVLTTATGIGGAITTARLNIDPARIIAWSCLLVCISFLTAKFLSLLIAGRHRRCSC